MWVFTSLFATVLSMILAIGLLVTMLWFPKMKDPNEEYTCPIWQAIRGLLFLLMSYYSLLFFDTAIKIFGGVFGYGNFEFLLAGILLSTILGLIIITGAVFTEPTWESLITFIFLVGYSYYQFNIFPETNYTGEREFLYEALMYPIFIQIIVVLIGMILRKVKGEDPLHKKPIWNIREKFKSKIKPRVYIILWFLICIEFILQMEGLSLFGFL